ncbi:unnamed protein product [Ixodes pacificus]
MARTRIKRQRLNAVISIRWHYGVSVSNCFALMTSRGNITLLLLAFYRCVSWLVQIFRGNLQIPAIFPPTMLNANLRCKLYDTISGVLHSFEHKACTSYLSTAPRFQRQKDIRSVCYDPKLNKTYQVLTWKQTWQAKLPP